MTHAIRVHRTGGPEVLSWERFDSGMPGPGEVLLRHTAIGVNFLDVYQRAGVYTLPLPFIPGNEGAGIIEAVGAGVTGFAVGDRVAYPQGTGAYTERRLITTKSLVHVPAAVDDATAAAVILKGLTAEFLVRRIRPLGPGMTVLFHAAAGGVGLIAGQWAASMGVRLIGTVGSDEKAALARANGYAEVINYKTEDFVARTKELTDGKGVDIVFDSVGKDTFPGSLDVLKRRGMFVTFGQSSGKIPDFSPLLLLSKGSLFMTRPTVAHYVDIREELDEAAAALFAAIASGTVKVHLNQTFPLREAAAAHVALESRQTTGSTVLLP